jgi:membrane protein
MQPIRGGTSPVNSVGRPRRAIGTPAWVRDPRRVPGVAWLDQTYLGRIIGLTIRSFLADDCTTRASVIAYATLMSLFPLLLVVLTAIGYVIADPSTHAQLVDGIAGVFPGASDLIQQTVDSVVKNRGSATIFATLTLLWSASGVFGALNRNVNAIWKVPKERGFLESSVLALFMVVAVALVFLVSLLVSTLFQLAHQFTLPFIDLAPLAAPGVYPLLALALPAVTTIGLFTLIYRFIPNIPIKWSIAFSGGLVAGLLFELGKQLFALYLSSFAHFDAVYGSIGAVIALLTWAYYSANILLLGCEVSHAAAKLHQNPE